MSDGNQSRPSVVDFGQGHLRRQSPGPEATAIENTTEAIRLSQQLQLSRHLVDQPSWACGKYLRVGKRKEARRHEPGPIPSTVLLPAATCVRPLDENVVKQEGWNTSAQPHASCIDRAQRFKLWAFACKRSSSSSSEHFNATFVCLSCSVSEHAAEESGQ